MGLGAATARTRLPARQHLQRDQQAAPGDVEDVVCSATILYDWNGDLNVTSFACGPFANESERTAFEHLRSRIESSLGASDDRWILLTNLTWSVTQQFQADEIDMIAIGPPGLRVIEVKHWSRRWGDEHPDLVDQEADRVTNKAARSGPLPASPYRTWLAPFTAENRHDLLEVLDDRHGVRSTVVTSQLPVDK